MADEARVNAMAWLRCVFHTATCSKQCSVSGCCSSSGGEHLVCCTSAASECPMGERCRRARELLVGVVTGRCENPQAVSLRVLLQHYVCCKDEACPLCGPVWAELCADKSPAAASGGFSNNGVGDADGPFGPSSEESYDGEGDAAHDTEDYGKRCQQEGAAMATAAAHHHTASPPPVQPRLSASSNRGLLSPLTAQDSQEEVGRAPSCHSSPLGLRLSNGSIGAAGYAYRPLDSCFRSQDPRALQYAVELTAWLLSCLMSKAPSSQANGEAAASRSEGLAYGKELWMHLLSGCSLGPACPHKCHIFRKLLLNRLTCGKGQSCHVCSRVCNTFLRPGQPHMMADNALKMLMASFQEQLCIDCDSEHDNNKAAWDVQSGR